MLLAINHQYECIDVLITITTIIIIISLIHACINSIYHLSIHQTIYQTRGYSSSYHGRILPHHLTCGSTTLEFETHSFPAKLNDTGTTDVETKQQ